MEALAPPGITAKIGVARLDTSDLPDPIGWIASGSAG
jgi:hypothetical protein